MSTQKFLDAKSGVSGAGKKLEVSYLFSECNENLTPYKVACHRHTPEVEEILKGITLTFVPHLVPMNRGIISTAYMKLRKKVDFKDVYSVYKDYYNKNPFIRLLPQGNFPEVKNVVSTNYCDIGLTITGIKKDVLIVISAIDNLIKGASGQAVQNMNIVFGLDEITGLI